MTTRDRAYLEEAFYAFYVEHDCGVFEESFERFLRENPECRAIAKSVAGDQLRAETVKRLRARFRDADQKEQEDPPPTPAHLREQFLPFHINVPPLSHTVNAFDGQGRLPMTAASPKQHRAHQREYKRFHARGVAYRQECENGCDRLIEDIRRALPDVEHPENLPMREIVELLKKLQPVDDAEPDTAAAPPPV